MQIGDRIQRLIFIIDSILFKSIIPEQFIKIDKWSETPLKNRFPTISPFTKQGSANHSSFLFNVSDTTRNKFEQ